jgi:hypothetical protein
MEALLSHSFDYLASPSPQKIRKGLRQVEGLLAQICLSKASAKADRRQSMLALGSSPPPSPTKQLCDLKDDPAFREFFKLQQGFQWNVTMRLISCLERLMGKGSNGTNDLLIISTLDLIQGALLLHPPSRELFAREIYMNVSRTAFSWVCWCWLEISQIFLDLLDPSNCPAIQSSTLLTLVSSLLDHPQNARTFEFLYFYLMPETPSTHITSSASATNTAVLGGRGKELIAAFDRRRETVGGGEGTEKINQKTRNTEDKQRLLGKHLSNVQDLVEDLREGGGLFGGCA